MPGKTAGLNTLSRRDGTDTARLSAEDNIARFCEHDGIFIHFSRAASGWRALATGALKPWWLKLTLSRQRKQNGTKQNTFTNNNTNANKKIITEVTDNA